MGNPKKRKNNESFLKNEYKAFLEKTKIFNAELNEFKNTLYSEEFRKTLQDDKHIFMNKHFPESYDAENFYKYIYLINKKRSEDPQICELKRNDCVLSNQPKEEISKSKDLVPYIKEMKQIWKFDKTKTTEKEIENLLFEVEKQFPIEDFKWTQEVVLELFMKQDYNSTSFFNILNEATFKHEIEERATKGVAPDICDDMNKRSFLRKTAQREIKGFYVNK